MRNSDKIVGSIYDLGCGEKPYEHFFLGYGKVYVGVDWGSTLHSLKADIVADLNKTLPLESEIADTVISVSVIEHLSSPQTMISEAFRILKPGGYFLLQVPWQWRIHEAPYDYFRFTKYGLKFLLENSGFKDVKIESQCGLFTSVSLKINYFLYRLVRGPWVLKVIVKGFIYLPCSMLLLVSKVLDKADLKWELETAGYVVVAHKQ